MPHPSQCFEIPKTSSEEMTRKWMASQTKVNECMKDQVVELENQINQGLRNRQAIIKNLKRQFEYLEKISQTKSLPHATNTKPKHEFVYKPLSIQNEDDKGDVKAIEEDEIKPISTIPNPNPNISNSPTVSPFLKDCTMHIPYTNVKIFTDDVLANHVGGEGLNLANGIGNRVLTKKEIKKGDKDLQRNLTKEWKLNEKVVPHNKEVYHYLWHPT
nr:hypothetical protein [Tanacetum cinerariifolium]